MFEVVGRDNKTKKMFGSGYKICKGGGYWMNLIEAVYIQCIKTDPVFFWRGVRGGVTLLKVEGPISKGAPFSTKRAPLVYVMHCIFR